MSKETRLFEEHYENCIDKTWNFAKRCKTFKDHLFNAVLGLAGEAGEVADQVKKWQYHTEKSDAFHKEKLVSELGDVFFYLIKFMKLTDITLEEVLKANMQKLQSRHPELGIVKERFAEGYVK